MPDSAAPVIDTEHVAFMAGGVSISVAGCNGQLPSVSRALGCRVSEDRREVTVFLAASQTGTLLDDVASNGAIAVVFSQPATHRTMQIKGRNARIVALAASDAALVDAYRAAFVGHLDPLGYDTRVISCFLSCAPNDLVALAFAPYAAFSQTPGPRAGEPLRAGA